MPLSAMQENSDTAIEIFSPVLVPRGFLLTRAEVSEYFTHTTFRRGQHYIKITADSFPTCYPWSFNVLLGEGDSETFLEYDWNSIGLWQLKVSVDPAARQTDYALNYDGKLIMENLVAAREDLVKYGKSFLEGDTAIFLETRRKINETREPYRVSYIDENGNRKVAGDQESSDMKKKYS